MGSSAGSSAGTGTAERCPECGHAIPVNPRLVTWCDACNWNLHAPSIPQPKTRFERLYRRAGIRVSDRLAGQLAADESSRSRLTWSLAAAYVVAALVYLGLVTLAAAGLAALVVWFPNPIAWIGLLVAVLAFLMRPRLGRLPKEGRLDREEAPRLYACVDAIAAALGTRSVDLVVVDAAYNASWSVVGLRRRRVLRLGLPLLTMLSPAERIALIAHELSHARNRDARRGVFVGGAVRAMLLQYQMLQPDGELVARYHGERWNVRRESGFGGLDFLFHALMWVISRPSALLLQLEWHLLLHEAQRAEYLADLAAADVAGTDATVGLLEKLMLESTFRGTVQHASRRRDSDLFAELATVAASIPERERLRRHRVARLEEARLNATHPPTARRIDLLERRRHREPELSPELTDFDAELAHRRADLQSTLVDRYRAAVYR